jgi:hypothetical protein
MNNGIHEGKMNAERPEGSVRKLGTGGNQETCPVATVIFESRYYEVDDQSTGPFLKTSSN